MQPFLQFEFYENVFDLVLLHMCSLYYVKWSTCVSSVLSAPSMGSWQFVICILMLSSECRDRFGGRTASQVLPWLAPLALASRSPYAVYESSEHQNFKTKHVGVRWSLCSFALLPSIHGKLIPASTATGAAAAALATTSRRQIETKWLHPHQHVYPRHAQSFMPKERYDAKQELRWSMTFILLSDLPGIASLAFAFKRPHVKAPQTRVKQVC